MLKNSFYNIIGSLIRLILGVIVIPLLIHFVGISEYGIFSLVSATIGLITLAEAGLSVSTTVFISRDLSDNDMKGMIETLIIVTGCMLILATVAAVATYFGAKMLITFFPQLDTPHRVSAIQAIQIGSLVVWAKLLQQVLIGFVQAYQKYFLINVVNTLQSILFYIGIISVAWLGGHTVALMYWFAASSLLTLLVYVIYVRLLLKDVKLYFKWNTTKIRQIASYSLATWFASLGGKLFSQGDRLIVGALLDPSSLGVYSAITNVVAQINSLSGLVVQPLLPTLSTLWSRKQVSASPLLKNRLQQATNLNAFVSLGLGAFILVMALPITNFILPNLAKSQYFLSFQIITIIYSLYSLNAVGYYTLFGTEGVKINLIVVSVSGIFSLLLIAIGARMAGITGAIAGNIGYLGTLALIWFGMKQVKIQNIEWMTWLCFPVLWFLTVVLNCFALNDYFKIQLSIFAIQALIFCGWFAVSSQINIKSSLNYVLYRQKPI